jgi:hypothetical protein
MTALPDRQIVPIAPAAVQNVSELLQITRGLPSVWIRSMKLIICQSRRRMPSSEKTSAGCFIRVSEMTRAQLFITRLEMHDARHSQV